MRQQFFVWSERFPGWGTKAKAVPIFAEKMELAVDEFCRAADRLNGHRMTMSEELTVVYCEDQAGTRAVFSVSAWRESFFTVKELPPILPDPIPERRG
jgi:hypothetical protein